MNFKQLNYHIAQMMLGTIMYLVFKFLMFKHQNRYIITKNIPLKAAAVCHLPM
jgi:hypothetical protein